MKLTYSILVLIFVSLNLQASPVESIRGQDGIEIYKLLKNTLNVVEQRNGDAPEAGCYNMTEMNFMDMVCVSESCTSEETYEREFFAACYFDQVDDKEFSTIQSILENSGLNPDNEIFNY